MEMLRVTVVAPAALRAVTTYGDKALTVEGVPLIMPLALFNDRPGGRGGAIDHVVTVPLTVGVLGVIAVPTTHTSGLIAYIKLDGATSAEVTVTLNSVFVDPAELEAVTV
jgi:hypothetical protein